ncbi:hypothetical protein TELCIR_12799, partial [Teladorsagia circumcincta]
MAAAPNPGRSRMPHKLATKASSDGVAAIPGSHTPTSIGNWSLAANRFLRQELFGEVYKLPDSLEGILRRSLRFRRGIVMLPT